MLTSADPPSATYFEISLAVLGRLPSGCSTDAPRRRYLRLPLIEETGVPQGRRVLVVDDNPDHRALLAELLRGRGYEVIEAQDASEALQLISGQKPDACVIDIGLPGMDGFELARKLREIPETRSSRLIAVTGYGTRADKAIFEEAGFDRYLPNRPTSRNSTGFWNKTNTLARSLSTGFERLGRRLAFAVLPPRLGLRWAYLVVFASLSDAGRV